MSIAEYVRALTKEQLNFLIERAQLRLVEIATEGYVELYGVFGGNKTRWFESKKYAEAFFLTTAKQVLSENYPELSMEKRKVPLNELAEYLGKEKAESIIKNGSLIMQNQQAVKA